jgi:hypothetical protein
MLPARPAVFLRAVWHVNGAETGRRRRRRVPVQRLEASPPDVIRLPAASAGWEVRLTGIRFRQRYRRIARGTDESWQL